MDIVLNQDVTITNADLKKVTSEIRKASANVIGNTFKISALIAHVDDNPDMLEADGFTDTFDYVKKCFGLEKASAYNLIRVGRDFITKMDKGGYETLLTHAGKDFSISQVFKMLPLGIDKAKELTDDGVIDVTMSCRQIEKIVKDNTDGTKARGKAKTDPEPVDTVDEGDDTECLFIDWNELPEEIRNYFTDNNDLNGVDSIQITM